MRFYTLGYAATALSSSNNVSLNIKNPLIVDMSSLPASFQAIDFANGNTFVRDEKGTFLWFKNSHVSNSITITFVSQDTKVPNKTVTLAAGEEALVGPFTYGFGSVDGTITVTYTGTAGTDITVAVVDLENV